MFWQKEIHRLTDFGNELMFVVGVLVWVGVGDGCGEGLVREFGMDMYTLLYLKWITRTYCIAHGTLLNVMCQP